MPDEKTPKKNPSLAKYLQAYRSLPLHIYPTFKDYAAPLLFPAPKRPIRQSQTSLRPSVLSSKTVRYTFHPFHPTLALPFSLPSKPSASTLYRPPGPPTSLPVHYAVRLPCTVYPGPHRPPTHRPVYPGPSTLDRLPCTVYPAPPALPPTRLPCTVYPVPHRPPSHQVPPPRASTLHRPPSRRPVYPAPHDPSTLYRPPGRRSKHPSPPSRAVYPAPPSRQGRKGPASKHPSPPPEPSTLYRRPGKGAKCRPLAHRRTKRPKTLSLSLSLPVRLAGSTAGGLSLGNLGEEGLTLSRS